MRLAVAALLVAAAPALAAPSTAGKSMAVIDVQPLQVDAKVAAIVTDAIVAQAAKVPGLKVVSKADVRALLSLEKQQQLLGCDNDKCQADVAGALGVDWLLSGSLGKLGGEYFLTIKVLDVKAAAALGREDRKVHDEGGLPDAARDLVALLLTGKTRDSSGSLSIHVNREGATILVDGHLAGLSPMSEPDRVPEGRHEVKVTLDGYIPFLSSVDVRAGGDAAIDVTLLSVSQAVASSSIRGWGYALMGLGAVLGGAGGYFYYTATQAYGDPNAAQNASTTYLGARDRFSQDDATSKVKQNLLFANGGFIGGGAIAGLGLILVIVDVATGPSAVK